MWPEDEQGRPRREGGPGDEQLGGGYVEPKIADLPEPWQTIRTGWARSGDSMPRPGSLAWLALAEDDPVRVAAAAAERLGAAGSLRRHGPSCARLLAEVTG